MGAEQSEEELLPSLLSQGLRVSTSINSPPGLCILQVLMLSLCCGYSGEHESALQMGNGAVGTRGIGGRGRNKVHTSQLQVLFSWSQEKKEVSTPDPACTPNFLGVPPGNVDQGLRPSH